jgi:hypothetical protein
MARALARVTLKGHGYALFGEPSKLRAEVRFLPGPLATTGRKPLA